MRTQVLLLSMLMFAAAPPARSEDIAQVLERSQASRIDPLPESHTVGAEALRASFATLQRRLRPAAAAELRVVDVGVIAETMRGRTVVVNAALGELPEICRLFVLAHELGHVQAGHWAERVALYRRWIPGEVVKEATDAVAPALGREASRQAHDQEFAADAYAMHALLDMGYQRDELLDMFMRLGSYATTATHPSSGKRMVQLRLIEEERRLAGIASPGEPLH